MKHTAIKESGKILKKIETIEKEIHDLKISVMKKHIPSKSKTISLKGIVKGVVISDKDIADAKSSLYDDHVDEHEVMN